MPNRLQKKWIFTLNQINNRPLPSGDDLKKFLSEQNVTKKVKVT